MITKIKLPNIEYWEPISGLLHAVAALASLLGLIYITYISTKFGDTKYLIANVVFMVSMLFVYTASAVYHIVPMMPEAKDFFRRLDHAMIFILIAGTYTPIYTIALDDQRVPILLIVMWSIAIVGIGIKMAKVYLPQKYSTGIYLGMGWMGIIKINLLFQAFGQEGFWWWNILYYWCSILHA